MSFFCEEEMQIIVVSFVSSLCVNAMVVAVSYVWRVSMQILLSAEESVALHQRIHLGIYHNWRYY